MGKMTTLADVAARAGVSTQTVSNALNKPSMLRRATLDRVLRAVDELGYVPNLQARRLRQRSVATIGVRVEPNADTIAASLADRFLHELATRADAQGQHVLLFTARTCEEEVQKIRQLVAQRVADSFVISSPTPDDLRLPALLAAGTRFVVMGQPWGPAPEHRWVDIDGAAGIAEVTEALIDAGHRRIGFLGWPLGGGRADDRHSGWVRVMRQRLGLDDEALEALCMRCEDRLEAGMPAAAQLIDRGAEALVCASDSLAMGAAGMAMQRGNLLPVTGFGNTPLAMGTGFPSVDENLGELAAATLAALGSDEYTTTILQPHLVRRDHPYWGINSPQHAS